MALIILWLGTSYLWKTEATIRAASVGVSTLSLFPFWTAGAEMRVAARGAGSF